MTQFLNSPNVPFEIRSGVNLTIARMNSLGTEKMVQYFWSALATENAIKFSMPLAKIRICNTVTVTQGKVTQGDGSRPLKKSP